MSKYINQDVAKGCIALAENIDMAFRFVNDMETIDIVHCRDCKHNPKYTKDFQYGRCVCTCDDDWYSYEPSDDFFCGYGERKDNE